MKLMDQAFFLTESKANPKHVAGMMYFKLPEGKDHHFLDDLYNELKQANTPQFPLNSKIKTFLGIPIGFNPLDTLNMDYHINKIECSDVRKPAEINPVIAKLHETKLDRSQPLWQLFIIKSLATDEFVLYVKVHHIYGDGISLLRWMINSLNTEAGDETWTPFWELEHAKKKYPKKGTLLSRLLGNIWGAIWTSIDMVRMLIRMLGVIFRVNIYQMPAPFTGKRTVLTGNVKPGRAVATTSIDLDKIIGTAKLARASVNEVMLTIIDIAVKRLLKDYGTSFDKPLIAMMPMSLRAPDDTSMGNKIAFPLVLLGYGSKDPYVRLRQIIRANRIIKKSARKVRPTAFSLFTMIYQSLSLVAEALKLSGLVRPMGNILISNVPGPQQQLYMKGCKLEAMYPISTLVPGGGVNITLVSYNGEMNVGFVCCDKHVKDLQPLAQYTEEAFQLLVDSLSDPTLTLEDLGESDTRIPRSLINVLEHPENVQTTKPVDNAQDKVVNS